MDAAGSLIEIWREAGISENSRLRRLQLRSAGRAGGDRHALLPGRTLLRDRRQARRRCADHVARHARCWPMAVPYHEAGASEAQELAGMLATLVAYLRACEAQGLRPRMALDKIALGAGGGRRPVPDHRQAARGARAGGPRRRGVRRGKRRGRHAPHRHHIGAHAGQARSVGEHAARDGGVRGCGLRRRRRHHACCPSPGRSASPTPSRAASRATRSWCCRRRARSAASSIPPRGAWSVEALTRRAGAAGLGAVSGHRGQGRHGPRAGERLRAGRDRQGRRGAGRGRRDRTHRVDGRVGVPQARRRRREGRSASAWPIRS